MLLIFDQMDLFAEDDLLRTLPLMSPEWRRKTLAHKPLLSQRLTAVSYLLLRHALGADPPPMALGPHGKPYFPSRPDLHFNLSHCPIGVALAWAPHPVGVDMEGIRPYRPQLARYCMSDSELELISSGDSARLFARLWTMKEALVKQSGRGLTTQLRTLLPPPEGLHIHIYDNPRWQLALCTPDPQPPSLTQIDRLPSLD